MATQFGNQDSAVKKPTNRAFVQNQFRQLQNPRGGGGGFADFASGLGSLANLAGAGMDLYRGLKFGGDEAKRQRMDAFNEYYKMADPDDAQVWAPETVRQIADINGVDYDQAYAAAATMRGQIDPQKRVQRGFNRTEEALYGQEQPQEGAEGQQMGQELPEGQEMAQEGSEAFVGDGTTPPDTTEVGTDGLPEVEGAMEAALTLSPEEMQEIVRSQELQAKAEGTPNLVELENQVKQSRAGVAPRPIEDVELGKRSVRTMRNTWEQSSGKMKLYNALMLNEVAQGRTPSADTIKNIALEREVLNESFGEAVLGYATSKMNVYGEYGDLIKEGGFTQDAVDYMRAMMDPRFKQQLMDEGTWEQIQQTPNQLPLQVWQAVQEPYGQLAQLQSQQELGYRKADAEMFKNATERQKVQYKYDLDRDKANREWQKVQNDFTVNMRGQQVDMQRVRNEFIKNRTNQMELNRQFQLSRAEAIKGMVVAKDQITNARSAGRLQIMAGLSRINEENKDVPEAKEFLQILQMAMPSAVAARNSSSQSSAATLAQTYATMGVPNSMTGQMSTPQPVLNMQQTQQRREYLTALWDGFKKKYDGGELNLRINGKSVPVNVSGGLEMAYHSVAQHMSVDDTQYRKNMEAMDLLMADLGFNNGGVSVSRPRQWNQFMNRLRDRNGGMLPNVDDTTFFEALDTMNIRNSDWNSMYAVYRQQYLMQEEYLQSRAQESLEAEAMDATRGLDLTR